MYLIDKLAPAPTPTTDTTVIDGVCARIASIDTMLDQARREFRETAASLRRVRRLLREMELALLTEERRRAEQENPLLQLSEARRRVLAEHGIVHLEQLRGLDIMAWIASDEYDQYDYPGIGRKTWSLIDDWLHPDRVDEDRGAP